MKIYQAFTLAEALITLAIIGIVAAMTLPALVSNYQKKVTAERVKKTYSEMLNVIKLSEAFNGDIEDWDFNLSTNLNENTRLFNEKYLLPYFKNLNYCDEGLSWKCGAPISGNGLNYVFNNGVGFAILAHFTDSSRNLSRKLSVIIDINGPQKPNVMGKDAFYFELIDNKFLPYEWDASHTRSDLIRGIDTVAGKMACRASLDTDTEIEINNNYNMYMCTALLLMDNWEIKADYPW